MVACSVAFRSECAPSLAMCAAEYALYRRLAAATAYQHSRAVRLFEAWLGRPATVGDLTDETVSRWLASLEVTHAQRTVAGHRTNVLTLWRDAAARGLCVPPNRVRRVPRPDPCPVAWTLDELRAVLCVCRQLTGVLVNNAPRADYFATLVNAAYDTGLRRSDLFLLRRDAIRADGSLTLRQHKTGRTHCVQLRTPTLDGLAHLPGPRPLSWPYHSPSFFYKVWKRIIRVAGVRHGALQQIRRTGASHLAIDHPERVSRYLGHRTPGMQRHYVDLAIAEPRRILPPPL